MWINNVENFIGFKIWMDYISIEKALWWEKIGQNASDNTDQVNILSPGERTIRNKKKQFN